MLIKARMKPLLKFSVTEIA